jgi:tRNA1(Val) A37 N6-methylase TrmN6
MLIKVCIYEILCIIFVMSIRRNAIQIMKAIFKSNISLRSNCVWTAKVIERKGNFIIAVIHRSYNGEEFVYLLGKYSMAPTIAN